MKYTKQTTLKEVYEQKSVDGKHPSWKASIVRATNKQWNKSLLSSSCEACGYSKHINLCHIKSISEYPDTATLGEVNDINNVIVLCPNHHWEFDNAHLTLRGITKQGYNKSYSYCINCNTQLAYSTHKSCKSCVSCSRKAREKIDWPSNEELLLSLKESNYLQLAKKLGVSDNAIRKRLKLKI